MSEKLHFEDLVVGATETFGSYAVTREAVLDFAEKFDPQPFHLDDEAAKHSMFGRIAASGWHTSAITMRIMVDNRVSKYASVGGAGVDKLRWVKPVYPGDTLSVRATIFAKRRSKSRPEIGFIQTRHETLNQDGEVVLTYESTGIVAVRDPSAPIDN